MMQLMTAISTVDDLNYPEKTETYYIVNVPYMFSACWKVYNPHHIYIKINLHSPPLFPTLSFPPKNRLKSNSFRPLQVVKPLLQERTKRKIQVLQGNGRDELLKVRKEFTLLHFFCLSCSCCDFQV